MQTLRIADVQRAADMELGARLVERAKMLGADLAGIVNLAELSQSPSHRLLNILGDQVDGRRVKPETPPRNGVDWPQEAGSVLVAGLAHPAKEPMLDWYDHQNSTLGNRRLMRLLAELAGWAENDLGLKTWQASYYVEYGGVYLKDAAVLAGLGVIGQNNLLLTPEFGGQVRLRALFLSSELPSSGPSRFDPCKGCKGYCRRACPQGVFGDEVHNPTRLGLKRLPGRDGRFSRSRCMNRLEKQFAESMGAGAKENPLGMDRPHGTPPHKFVEYCRRCELACPVARRAGGPQRVGSRALAAAEPGGC
jgi:epoxyqueuosine reductase